MIRLLERTKRAVQATQELGPGQTFWYMVYQLGLRSGFYRRATPPAPYANLSIPIRSPFTLPDAKHLAQILGDRKPEFLQEAEEITQGMVRLFGGPPVPLNLAPPNSNGHWTNYEGKPRIWGVEDIKYAWEPARFGWVYPLGRAYLLTGDERYSASFWDHFDTFIRHNPPNQGPNWLSAQEVALRLMALLYAACVFERSGASTPERLAILSGAIAIHAQRIPPTISYALAQNNNHLVSEALGLYAAGCALPNHPKALHWRQEGWRWLNYALQRQIESDGTYSQHSMNYHRLMLHAALQGQLMGQCYPEKTAQRLAAATTWLLAQLDLTSGRTPNLGSNDGALILPLSTGGNLDYRPVAQAAARAFLGQPALPPGPWDELGLWLGQSLEKGHPLPPSPESPAIHRLGSDENWASLRAVHFRGRPAHADQLHVELWWRGENVALDAGTYRYTASAPWDNALAQTRVHNTVEVEHQDQMVRAGRFLWLHWAQAALLETPDGLAAEHYGYRRLGLIHRRSISLVEPNHWQITDYLLPGKLAKSTSSTTKVFAFRLQWLLPDWPWEFDNEVLIVRHPAGGKVRLILSHRLPQHDLVSVGPFSLARAGEPLVGPEDVLPIQGWHSPTYGHKHPALSFSRLIQSPLPATLVSDWFFEE